MQRNSLNVYSTYRRLLILLLIFPIYKLCDAIVNGDLIMAYIMIISLVVGVTAIIYLETKLKAAQTVSQTPPAERN